MLLKKYKTGGKALKIRRENVDLKLKTPKKVKAKELKYGDIAPKPHPITGEIPSFKNLEYNMTESYKKRKRKSLDRENVYRRRAGFVGAGASAALGLGAASIPVTGLAAEVGGGVEKVSFKIKEKIRKNRLRKLKNKMYLEEKAKKKFKKGGKVLQKQSGREFRKGLEKAPDLDNDLWAKFIRGGNMALPELLKKQKARDVHKKATKRTKAVERATGLKYPKSAGGSLNVLKK